MKNISAPPQKEPAKPREPAGREGSLRHILDTGLPPGVEISDVKNPGEKSPKAPADDRS